MEVQNAEMANALAMAVAKMNHVKNVNVANIVKAGMKMSRYIDATLLFDYIQKEKAWKQGTSHRPRYDQGKYDTYYEMLEIIKQQPTVVAEPIVHCSDCIFWDNGTGKLPVGAHSCMAGCGTRCQDFFCKNGKRKD